MRGDMASSNLENTLLLSDNFKKVVSECYTDVSVVDAAKRFSAIYNAHTAKYKNVDISFFSSPGRIEVVGNHTDHNNGKVLCASICVDTLAAVSRNTEGKITVNSVGYSPFTMKLSELDAVERERGTSRALVKGVVAYFKEHGWRIGGFDLTATSDVYKGAGVSSSASFELLIATILNTLYNGNALSAIQLAQASQYSENAYFGKPCGLMDQSAIALGGISYIDFEDTASPVVKSIPWHLGDRTSIVLVNTGGDHSDLTADYAAIRTEMESIAAYFGQRTLRFVNEGDFYKALGTLQKEHSGRAILRAIHFFKENGVVEATAAAVMNNDLNAFLKGVKDSGDSSYKFLQNCYSTGDLSQRIPLALAIAGSFDGIQAVRVHGGGFAGTVLCFVRPERASAFIEEMSAVFGSDNVFKTGIRNTGATQLDI